MSSIRSLEGFETLRTFCFIWIFSYHTLLLLSFYTSTSQLYEFYKNFPEGSLVATLHRWMEAGYFAVDIFFALSTVQVEVHY
jgi:peptidoglycan/LPS O-acetylase OafA/YrhL